MKKKELKKLAQRIAALEEIASSNQDSAKDAQKKIMELTKKIHSPEEFFYLDELIQEILEEKKS